MRRSSAPLTELCNKRGMTMAPTRERNAAPKRSCRHRLHGRGQVKFKRINDTFGRAEGDDVLRAVTAAIARRCLRHAP
jgi:GGDEF domain-containing protein